MYVYLFIYIYATPLQSKLNATPLQSAWSPSTLTHIGKEEACREHEREDEVEKAEVCKGSRR